MSRHFPRFAAALLSLAPALTGPAADKDRYGDPLPRGATGRLGTVRLRSNSHAAPVLSPDAKTLYLASSLGGFRLLDPATGATVGTLQEQPPGTFVAFSADGKRGLQTTHDAVTVWDAGSGKALTKVAARAHSRECGAALSADGAVLAIGGAQDESKKRTATVTVWDVAANKEIASIAAPHNRFAQVALAPDGKTVAVWGDHFDPDMKPEDRDHSPERYVYFFDAAGGKELSRVRAAGYSPQAVVIGPTGLAAISAGTGAIDLVSPKTGGLKLQLLGRSGTGRFVTFSPDGAVVAATAGGAVQLWRVSDGVRLATVEPPVPGPVNARVRLLDNEKGIAWASQGLATFVWEVPSGKPLGPTEGHTSVVTSITVTPDGKYALTAPESGAALRWELATGKLAGEVPLKYPNPQSSGFPGAHVSPDGKAAVAHDSSGDVGVFDIATGAQWYVIPRGPFSFSRHAFSSDGSKIVTVFIPIDYRKKPAQVTVLDTASGKRLGVIELGLYSTLAAAVTPDGRHVITAGRAFADNDDAPFVITGWDLATGAKKGELVEKSQFHLPEVIAAPDNKTAAVATGNGKVIAFDLFEGKRVREYDLSGRAHGTRMVPTADGKRFAVACRSHDTPEPATPIVVFEWANGAPVQALTAPGFVPRAMAFTPDGKKLLTSAADSSVTVWELGQ
ncbi:WD40 repeat domain-containing protein [Gemmata sp. JC673]|uniref:WD40 repeat domain-containing protein n=1 Tax=Gemmata algarum TaxID=2975278 RepID=A0ABU5F6P6_9BACT|nr:WD40 repeat domain-containing protein [Gemmata algarum]MDY3563026.1 WD40 repeat domain-containing protein [Gemmata algarum]